MPDIADIVEKAICVMVGEMIGDGEVVSLA